MKTKIKAFTINEMIIVMIISVIVMGLAFTVLTMVQKHMWSIQNNFVLNSEFNRLEQALWTDTNRYNTMSYNKIDDQLILKSPIDSTFYYFDKENYVLKDKDTFKIEIGEKLFFFNGNQTKHGKVDAINITLHKPYINHSIFIYKINDAKQFMD